MRRASTWALPAVAVWLTASALAQEGAIAGRVVDTDGEPLPGTSVEVRGPGLSEPRLEVTDLQGRYRISGLSPGTYSVLFSLPGFGRVVRSGIEVGTGAAETVDAELAVGALDAGPDEGFIVVDPPLEGAIALACTFHPDGVIDNCRRVGVRSEALPPR